MAQDVDLFVIGGGVNGTAIARDAAGRGLSVMLCEKGDLAAATSSASTKLIHGGLRYLEYGEFRLVREALIEREVLLRAAPHIIRPLRLVLPRGRGARPAWMIRLGLFLYDHLGGRKLLPASRAVRLDRDPRGAALADGIRRGFVFSDCRVDDARLVVLYAVDAAERGAVIRTRTTVEGAVRRGRSWRISIRDAAGRQETVTARALVNATGPWVSRVRDHIEGVGPRQAALRLVKGSHIVTRRLYEGDHAYILQNTDRRVVFAIPYEGAFTLIGTTDIPCDEPPEHPSVSAGEIDYLCRAVNRWLRRAIGPQDIVWSYAGVRPLYDDQAADASAVTRDYVLRIDATGGAAPLLSVFGGKITTSRRLAEHGLDLLLRACGMTAPAWTATATLPGGDIAGADLDALIAVLRPQYPWLEGRVLRRLAHAYGTRVRHILGQARRRRDLGEDFGCGLSEAELDYLVSTEWARTAEDVLWRRSKLGLHLTPAEVGRVDKWMQQCLKQRAEAAEASDRR
ncbi:MAG: glycerol-3-phosphate dehydrogenase [Rhodothalassiaceae bacterium]